MWSRPSDRIFVKRATPIREVLEALEWARIERMRTGSPDFLRARVIEQSIQALCGRLIRNCRAAEVPNCRIEKTRANAEDAKVTLRTQRKT